MKVKAGQWLRYINFKKETKFYKADGVIEEKKFTVPLENIIKVADTPQELIQVGDIIKMKHNDKLQHISKTSDFVGVPLNSITEIHTRTDKDTYKCQWRK